MGGFVGEAVAAERGGAVDAEVVLLVLALARVRVARVEELLGQQAAQPLRRATHGRRLHGYPVVVDRRAGRGARGILPAARGFDWLD